MSVVNAHGWNTPNLSPSSELQTVTSQFGITLFASEAVRALRSTTDEGYIGVPIQFTTHCNDFSRSTTMQLVMRYLPSKQSMK